MKGMFEVEPERATSKYDRFIDGINRLGRPLMLIGVIAFFAWAIIDPVYFVEVMTALASTPEFVATAILTIIGIFGTGRIINDMKGRSTPIKRTTDINDNMESTDLIDNSVNSTLEQWKRNK